MYFVLCTLHFLGNIARGKPSTLSSIYKNNSIAALAVDGKKETPDCALSKFEENAWLRVDLQASAILESVTIVSQRYRAMRAFDVRAGNNFQDGGVRNPPCQLNINIPADSTTVNVQCPSGLIGRYVTLNTQSKDFLEICEVEVYGYYI